ncbi:predicted protein [Uncinocarpus reesii 1704]|uniref:Uncharacterized protein n=1 Tax=Uncinocarpus reesii (strain UAMH 1704) TaxID=336963 RepID=C4JLJ5_UNCRE|nr:uncharacterized protein UREG_03703 [Uncinocarpus reesii 1704]EEP78857.1 predicted protein [Uncinocarpus reesii 1704]
MSRFPLPPFAGNQAFPAHWLPDQSSGSSTDGPYQPYNHFAMPPQPLYGTNGTDFGSSVQIPGLTPFANGMLPAHQTFPMPNMNTASYYPQPANTQSSGPSMGFPAFLSPADDSQGNAPHHPNNLEQVIEEEQPTGSDQVAEQDSMDIDGREEGELSNGETETVIPDPQIKSQNVRKSPPADKHFTNGQMKASLTRLDTVPPAVLQTSAEACQQNSPHQDSGPAHCHSLTQNLKDPITPSDLDFARRSESFMNGRSLTQLRMQAQGALLNLAPHNIRYKQLVSEGIDPTILKSLYDSIGLKVAAEETSDNQATNANQSTVQISENEKNPTPLSKMAQNQIMSTTMSSSERPITSAAPIVSCNATASKPLERKDLIARMLAAKAGKPIAAQQPETQPTLEPKAVVASKGSIAPPELAVALSGPPSQSADEIRTKEKNKAQTELARQRIEQLRKMGLAKFQSQSTTDSVSGSPLPTTSSSINITPTVASPQDQRALQTLPMKHPLPERPPDPELTAQTRIPGLFMTGTETITSGTAAAPNSHQTAILEASSSAVRPHRKRPRASDFTDDVLEEPPQKQSDQNARSSSSLHRVVIDISEDESMYGVDTDEFTRSEHTAGKAPLYSAPPKRLAIRDAPPLSDVPSRPVQSYRSVSSTSLPQTLGKGRDEENIRSEITMMRQKIAELERRRDAKRAAQVQSSTTPAQSALSSIEASPNLPRDTKASNFSQAHTTQEVHSPISTPSRTDFHSTVATVPSASPLITHLKSPLTRSWSSLEPKKAEELRQKFLRKKEIESGLPALDAELSKSEARLAQFREEEKRLLAEIAKGKEGKRRLVEELEELGVETDGLTLEELQHTKDRLEAASEMREQTPDRTQDESFVSEIVEVPPSAETNPQILNLSAEAQALPTPSVEERRVSDVSSASHTSQEVIDAAPQTPSAQTVTAPEREDSIMSSCSSSAMDESMGSSVGDEEMIDEDQASSAPSRSEASSSSRSVQEIPIPSRIERTELDIASSRENSVISDAYEPPEPEKAVQSDPPATPPFSPAPVGPVTDDSLHAAQLEQNVQTLTLAEQKYQDTDSEESIKVFCSYI